MINSNAVEHPLHYQGENGIECWDAMEAAFGREAVMTFCLCNAFKYLYRCKHKNAMNEDLEKAREYLAKFKELDERDNQLHIDLMEVE